MGAGQLNGYVIVLALLTSTDPIDVISTDGHALLVNLQLLGCGRWGTAKRENAREKIFYWGRKSLKWEFRSKLLTIEQVYELAVDSRAHVATEVLADRKIIQNLKGNCLSARKLIIEASKIFHRNSPRHWFTCPLLSV